ncbi:hypothetical protein NMY22_g5023 [Coprinellus aureogranulatus]|nr:hypothetical protein NMY22_g5023 [Coprinellus aureogranulatus]
MPSKPAISKMKSSQSKKSTASKSQKEATYRSLERLPSILASELALMQFADGGKLDDHIQRLMPTQSGVASGVDREGVRSGHAKEVGKGELFAKPQNAEGRFGVKGSSGHTTYPTKVASSRKALPEARHTPLVKPGPMLLSLPSRSSHAADHLKRPKYIVDSRPFTTPMQAGASKSPKSPNGPSHRNTPSIGNKTRKRPAPLKLLPGLQKMRRIVAVSSPGSGVPPLSSRFFGFSRTPAKQGQLLEGGLNREGKMHSAHHGVSYFEDDSEDEFVR